MRKSSTEPDVGSPQSDADAAGTLLACWLDAHRRVFVLTGAGISTSSGIPAYRSPEGQWKGRAPITYQEFVGDPSRRARYWARSFFGWPTVARAEPNRGHDALVTLQAQQKISLLVTQNVDGLHTRGGHGDVVDLHGRIDTVRCLQCDTRIERAQVQRDLAARYPHWLHHAAGPAPDGDADLEGVDLVDFVPPACSHCAGMLKPDVVFFGENVPRDRVSRALAGLDQSDAMLVVGSSLTVYSGFRFARIARERGMPLAILTRGITRADDLATLKLNADCSETLVGALARRRVQTAATSGNG